MKQSGQRNKLFLQMTKTMKEQTYLSIAICGGKLLLGTRERNQCKISGLK